MVETYYFFSVISLAFWGFYFIKRLARLITNDYSNTDENKSSLEISYKGLFITIDLLWIIIGFFTKERGLFFSLFLLRYVLNVYLHKSNWKKINIRLCTLVIDIITLLILYYILTAHFKLY